MMHAADNVAALLSPFGLTEDDVRPEDGMIARIIPLRGINMAPTIDFDNQPRSATYDQDAHYERILNAVKSISDDGKAWPVTEWLNPGYGVKLPNYGGEVFADALTGVQDNQQIVLVYYYRESQVRLAFYWQEQASGNNVQIIFCVELDFE